MILIIETPDTLLPERDYIMSVVLGEFLGIPWRHVIKDRSDVRITISGYDLEVKLPDILFQTTGKNWLSPKSLPSQPLSVWDSSDLELPVNLVDKQLPVIYGDYNPRTKRNKSSVWIPLDIFGSAFFMLSRYEEIVKPNRDEHDRFPANASLAFQEKFLLRPIVDEYIEVLWAVIKSLWPGLERKKNYYQIYLSHDVDSALYSPFAKPLSLAKQMAGDMIKRTDLLLAWKRVKSMSGARRGYYEEDPHNTFDFIMNCSERHGLKSAFYFMTGGISKRDARYNIYMPWIKKLIKNIANRGHEIGLHASYETYLDPRAIKNEFKNLLHIADECNVHQKIWGGRQHVLRWYVGKTWNNWHKAGLSYDSTLGYAQHVGFRCGCCREYPVFDLIQRKSLLLRERPLIVMEGTLFNSSYMGYSYKKSAQVIEKLSKICKIFKGHFSLLWHNTKLISRRQKNFYFKMIASIKS